MRGLRSQRRHRPWAVSLNSAAWLLACGPPLLGEGLGSRRSAQLEAVRDGIDAGWYYFWDVLAAVATARPDVLACRDETIDVVTRKGPMLGRTRPSASGWPGCVVEEINRRAFEEDLLNAILD